jgi:hypothetical protein
VRRLAGHQFTRINEVTYSGSHLPGLMTHATVLVNGIEERLDHPIRELWREIGLGEGGMEGGYRKSGTSMSPGFVSGPAPGFINVLDC